MSAAVSFRNLFLLGFAACAGLLAYAFYLAAARRSRAVPAVHLPARRVRWPWVVVFLVGGLHAPRGRGGARRTACSRCWPHWRRHRRAGNHVRLQHLPPDQVPACGPGLDYMLEAMPITGVSARCMTGSGECAKVDWTFLGLSMPAWSLSGFVLLAWAALWPRCRRAEC